jgi:hypothetical protein
LVRPFLRWIAGIGAWTALALFLVTYLKLVLLPKSSFDSVIQIVLIFVGMTASPDFALELAKPPKGKKKEKQADKTVLIAAPTFIGSLLFIRLWLESPSVEPLCPWFLAIGFLGYLGVVFYRYLR